MDAAPPAAWQREELARRTRASGILAGVLAVVAVPSWIAFDAILEPDHVATFVAIRLLSEVVMLPALWCLVRRPVGHRRPELPVFAIVATTQVAIAYMIPRVHESLELYLLGFSLAVYASGSLIAWHPRWTLATIGVTWGAAAVSFATVPDSWGADIAASGFYLATASLIAFLAQIHRHKASERELATRDDLERAQEHTQALLSELERLSNEDALTGLGNRRRWDAELARACADAARTGADVSVLLVDVDHFKDINDTYGHPTGDAALRAVAHVLLRRVRRNDLVARLGGDEFAVLLVGTDATGATKLAREIVDTTRDMRPLGAVGPSIAVSIGVASATGAATGALDLLARADEELYRAKAARAGAAVQHLGG